MACARRGGFIVSSGAEFKEIRWAAIAAAPVRSPARSRSTIEFTFAGECMAAHPGHRRSRRLPDATHVDVRDVELPPAPVGGEYRTPFDETGREAGTIAQPQTSARSARSYATARTA